MNELCGELISWTDDSAWADKDFSPPITSYTTEQPVIFIIWSPFFISPRWMSFVRQDPSILTPGPGPVLLLTVCPRRTLCAFIDCTSSIVTSPRTGKLLNRRRVSWNNLRISPVCSYTRAEMKLYFLMKSNATKIKQLVSTRLSKSQECLKTIWISTVTMA